MNIRRFLKEKRKLASQAIRQDEAIEKCLYCQNLKKSIELHHPEVKGLASATIKIIKCNECNKKILFVINCAKRGHLIP